MKQLKQFLAASGAIVSQGEAMLAADIKQLEEMAHFKGMKALDFHYALAHDIEKVKALFGKAPDAPVPDADEAQRKIDAMVEAQRLQEAADALEAQRLADEQAAADAEAKKVADAQQAEADRLAAEAAATAGQQPEQPQAGQDQAAAEQDQA